MQSTVLLPKFDLCCKYPHHFSNMLEKYLFTRQAAAENKHERWSCTLGGGECV